MSFERSVDQGIAQTDDGDESTGEHDDSTINSSDLERDVDVAEHTVHARPKQHRGSRKRPSDEISDRELMDAILKSGEQAKQLDDVDYFARSVGETMRRMNSRQQAAVKVKITQLLFEVEFGLVDSNSAMPNSTMPQTELNNNVENQPGDLVTAAVVEQPVLYDAPVSSDAIIALAMAECGIPVPNIVAE